MSSNTDDELYYNKGSMSRMYKGSCSCSSCRSSSSSSCSSRSARVEYKRVREVACAPKGAEAKKYARGFIPEVLGGPLCDVKGLMSDGACGKACAVPFKQEATISTRYRVDNFVSDVAGVATFTQSNLLNPWGCILVGDLIWVCNTNTSSITSYAAAGNLGKPTGVVINIPLSFPSALTCNRGNCFAISSGGLSRPASVIGVTLEGGIFAVNAEIDSKNAIIMKLPEQSSPHQLSVFTGISIFEHPVDGTLLYITDFKQAQIHVYNTSFAFVKSFAAEDPALLGYGPYSIVTSNTFAYVGYAKQEQSAVNPMLGYGAIEVFDLNRNVPLMRLALDANFNIPSAMIFLNGLLVVGNYGSGKIFIVDPASGTFLSTFKDCYNNEIALTFLRSMVCSGGKIFFVSAINGAEDGLIGALTLV